MARRSTHLVPVEGRPPGLVGSAVGVLPGLVRLGAQTAVHTTTWGVTASARGWGRVAKAVVDPDAAARLSDDLSVAAGAVAEVARALSGTGPLSRVVEARLVPALDRARLALEERGARGQETEEQRLRRGGEELLQRSRDVWSADTRHPAYAGILRELAPDEARIVVLLLRDGPQPAVDVRAGSVGRGSSGRLVARGLTMIGARAGVRYLESVPQYLNNLTRLGLIWQSPEPLRDLVRYQVVEAQPDVLAAKHSVRRARIERRSVHLTPFGVDFARICFADVDEAALFPAHLAPPEAAAEIEAAVDPARVDRTGAAGE